MDLLLVNPATRERTYGDLAASLSGIEPPFWAGLVASYVRQHGRSVDIIDADAGGWDTQYTAEQIAGKQPDLVAMIIQGANPSASSTPKMDAAADLVKKLKEIDPQIKTLLGGIHPSALPARTLEETTATYVCKGEPFRPVLALLDALKVRLDSVSISGIWSRAGKGLMHITDHAALLDTDELPPVAWDLLDMSKYRCHNWHALDDLSQRNPYAVLYTSFGCPYNCRFCDVKTLYGGDRRMRYRKINEVVRELDILVKEYGVRKIKIMDEMFALDESRVLALCDKIIGRGYDLDMWAYGRVDTVTPLMLKKMKEAGINWICFGLEAGDEKVLSGIGKSFNKETVDRAIRMTREAGMYNMPAIIFGLPNDTVETMQETLNMAELYNFEYINMYCAAAYPGSELWDDAVERKLRLPPSWEAYSQLHQDFVPLPTRYLTPEQVLRFRDEAFRHYFFRNDYLSMIREKFGNEAVRHINGMLEKKIKRRIFGE